MHPVQVTLSPKLRLPAVLRRYMDFGKFLDMLHSQTLYLRRADGFGDRLEGALFPSFRRSLDKAHANGQVEHGADYFYQRARTGSYVSCWSIGAHDNMALWQLYGGVKGSLAITTTVNQLANLCHAWKRTALIRKVAYVDHPKMKTYVIGAYTDVLEYKNTAYSYEEELRVIVPAQGEGWEANPLSLRLPIPSFNTFIRSVVMSPESEPELLSAVKDVCAKYGLHVPVRRSKLAVVST